MYDLGSILQPLLGLILITALAWALSEDRRAVRPRLILAGIGLQVVLALLLLKLPPAKQAFLALNDLVLALQRATQAGTELVFGFLGGGATPFEPLYPEHSFVLAFQALPLLLVISALSALLFHWHILPVLVRGFAWALRRTLGTGGPLGLAAAANVFIGMTEAPLLIRPYLAGLSRGALFGVMTCGMATVAGTVMVLYASILGPVIPDALGHILTASIISAPAALMIAGVLVPGSGPNDDTPTPIHQEARGAMDAITRGTLDAIPLWLNILAMLVVMVALVSLANEVLGLLPAVAGEPLTAQRLLGWLMAPVVWLIGIPWSEASTAGGLMGIKTVLNELVAYLELAKLPDGALSERSE
ncbi:MAG: NupC/NupG family nucleoside CNT transporter, partial [Bdellovibrio bacteriovorus]